jgi:hypothetical protein
MKILNFFLFLWVIFALLDPDPATQIKADPDPQPWMHHALIGTNTPAQCAPEGLECDDDVGDVELGLEVELDGGVLLAAAGLPPRHPLLSAGRICRLPPVDDVRHVVGQLLQQINR